MGRVAPRRTWERPLKVLVTGGAGLVATHLVRAAPSEHDLTLTWHDRTPPDGVPAHRVDLVDRAATEALFAAVAPDVVVHTAYSMTNRSSIVEATEHVASSCRATGAAMVHLSSDAVFSGDDPPYVETDPPQPITDYGRWKAEAESIAVSSVPDVCITRTSLVVSLDPHDAATAWLVDAIRAGERPGLFTDEWRTPLRAVDLAESLWALVAMSRTDRAGVWHLPGPEVLSRWQIAERVAEALRLGALHRVARPGSIAEHPTPRAGDLTLRSDRNRPGPEPGPVP